MSRAEEGGNQPQRVLLIGGPKHSNFVNLPEGQDEYELTTDKSLTDPGGGNAWGNWPQTASHFYKRDDVLSRLVAGCGPLAPSAIFTHEVLWRTPHQGGFNLHALRTAEKTVQEAMEKVKAAQEREKSKNEQIGDLLAEKIELQHTVTEQSALIQGARAMLESSMVTLTYASLRLGDYKPMLAPIDE